MKKLVFAFAAVVALSFASCKGNTANDAVNDSDTVAAQVEDTVAPVDTLAADTLAADTLAQ